MAGDLGRAACFWVAMVLLGACATDESLIAQPTTPVRAMVRDVPYVESEAGSVAGATATVLGWAGLRASPGDLSLIDGNQSALSVIREARRHGCLAYPLDSWAEIIREVAAQHPVLICLRADVGAAADDCRVLVGYDLEAGKVVAHSPLGASREQPLRDILAGWEMPGAWALVVLPAGELPATVEREEYIAAAAGLERDGPAWEAVLALDSALALWHDSVEALMGLGKSLFALGDRKGAAEAFATASGLTDDPAIARWQWAVAKAAPPEKDGKLPAKSAK